MYATLSSTRNWRTSMLLKRFLPPIGFPAGCSGSRDARFAAVVKAAKKRWTEVRKQAKKVGR
jgi:hypothetical protein